MTHPTIQKPSGVKRPPDSTSHADGPPSKKGRYEVWASDQHNALFRLVPQLHTNPQDPFKDIAIVVEGSEGLEPMTFTFSKLVLINLSQRFQEIFTQDDAGDIMTWKGIHPQAVEQLSQHAHWKSLLIPDSQYRSIAQLQAQFPQDFEVILTDLVKLYTEFQINSLEDKLFDFLCEDLEKNMLEKIVGYFRWALKDPTHMQFLDTVFNHLQGEEESRLTIYKALATLFTADHSSCNQDQQLYLRNWSRHRFEQALAAATAQEDTTSEQEIYAIAQCLVDLHPRFDFAENTIMATFPLISPGKDRKPNPLNYVLLFCEVHSFFFTHLDLTNGKNLVLPPLPPNWDRISVFGPFKHYRSLVGAMHAAHQDQPALIQALLKEQPENVFALQLQGLIHYRQQNYPAAIANYTAALMINPEDTLALRNRAYCHRRCQDTPSALADLAQLIGIQPENPENWILRAKIYYSQGEYDPASSDVKEAISRCSSEELSYLAEAYNLKGKCLWKKGKKNSAFAAFDKALTHMPRHIDALEHRGRYLLEFKKDFRRASEDFTLLIQINPNSAFAYRMRGECHKQRANYDRESNHPELAKIEFDAAIADLNQAAVLTPNDPLVYLSRGEFYLHWNYLESALVDLNRAHALHQDLKVLLLRAHCLELLGDIASAIADFNLAIGLEPTSPGLYYDRAGLYQKLGEIDAFMKDLKKAVELDPKYVHALTKLGSTVVQHDIPTALRYLNRAIGSNPGYAPAWAHRADCYWQLGDIDAALEDFNESIRLKPDDSLPFLLRAERYEEAGNLEMAIIDYAHAIILDPKNAQAFACRGNCFIEAKEPEQGLNDLDRAIELDPRHHFALLCRAEYYASVAKFKEAIQDYSKIIEIEPESVPFIKRAECQWNLGKFDEAIEDYTRGLDLDPQDARAYAYRAFCFMKKGEIQQARADVDRALQLDPKYAYAKELKRELGLKR